MEGVEHAIPGVVRIEDDVGEPGREVPRVRELREQARPLREPVEVEILRERLRLLVEDVQRSVEIVHEEAAATRFVPQVVDAGELCACVLVGVVRRDRQRGVVLEFQRQPRCGLQRQEARCRGGQQQGSGQ